MPNRDEAEAHRKQWDTRGRKQQGAGSSAVSVRGDWGESGDVPSFNPESGLTTEETFRRPDGTWHPARRALHEQWIREALAGVPKSEHPTIFVLGGGTASGKSSTIASGAVNYIPDSKKAVWVNPDTVKTKMPEWDGIKTQYDSAASMVHDESSSVSKDIVDAALAGGHDIVLDTCGDSGYDNLAAKIAKYRAAGYRVVGTYATVPTDVAVERAAKRASDPHSPDYGRKPPEYVIRSIHRAISRDFERCQDLFDSVELYDTRGPRSTKPVLVARGGRGRKLDIQHDDFWRDFLAKANG